MKTKTFEIIGKVVVKTIEVTVIAGAAVTVGAISGIVGGIVGAAVVETYDDKKIINDCKEDQEMKEAKAVVKEFIHDVKSEEETEEK